MRTIAIPITTAADGTATATRNGIHGLVHGVVADADAFDNTVDITVTDARSGVLIASFANLSADAVRRPMVVPTQPDGTALATAGNTPPLATGRVTITVAQGGNVLSGVVYLTIE